MKRSAEQARDLLTAGRGAEIGPLMNHAFDLRARLISISPGNLELIQRGPADWRLDSVLRIGRSHRRRL